MEPAYWEKRLFKNTFTYKGRSRKVNAWCVKMQLFGRRKTFSLSSSDRAKAAIEASHIYQTINGQGWDAVGQRRGRIGFQTALAETTATTASGSELDVESWKSRLIHRRYPEPANPAEGRNLSVRIEHSGISRYFPLGTQDENQAALLAREIHQTVVNQGWGIANQKFSRELTLAFRWLEDPLAWTYTTLHTQTELNDSVPVPNDKTAGRLIAVIEADPGIRSALADCTNGQEGFACCATYSSVAEALREITRRRIDMVIINYALPDQPGANCLAALQKEKPGVVGLLYSVFEDSDQLFKSTPGGAAGYLLKRTPAHRIFDPIADATGSLTREVIAFKIREYFQRLISAMPSGPSALEMAKLTPREHEILTLLAKGDLAKEIADSLGISIWTVHGHVKSIFEKFNVHTRTEAVVKFLQK
ncbi:MAG TPA: response regulator transcription factor [Verrucomicrobiae bacterium]|jgi:DNA-binding NarL/FixJ family response regulator|nr:response regulator transcription factor [Verrucomicrobiae bacterium]